MIQADYTLVRRWWHEVEGWPAAALAEADARIRAITAGRDAARIAGLACDLSRRAEEIRRFEASVRAAEARMRAAEERAAA